MTKGDVEKFEIGTGAGLVSKTAKLLDAQTAADDGKWVPWHEFKTSSLMVEGMAATEVVKLCVTLRDDPADNYNGIQLGSDITQDGVVAITGPWSFIKARKTTAAGSPGSVSVYLHGVAP